MRVPLYEAPQVRRVDTFGPLVDGVERVQAAYDQKQRQDANVFTALESAKLRAKYTQRLTEAQANGEIDEHWMDTLNSELERDRQEIVSRLPNGYAEESFGLSFVGLQGDIQAKALGQQAQFNIDRRSNGLSETNTNLAQSLSVRGQTFADLQDAYDKMTAAIEGVQLPDAVKNAHLAARSQLASSWARAQAETNPRGLVAMLDKGHQVVSMLDPKEISVVRNMADVNIREQEAAARVRYQANATEAVELVKDDLKSLMFKGVPANRTPAQDAALRAGRSAEELAADNRLREDAQTFYAGTNRFATMKTEEIDKALAGQAPKPGETDARRLAVFGQMQAYRNQLADQRLNDPGQAAYDGYGSVRSLWTAYQQNRTSENLQAAMKATLGAQKDLGIADRDQRAVPEFVARDIAGRIKSLPTDQIHIALKDEAQRFGPLWDKVSAQILKPLDPSVRVAATMGGNDEMANLLIANSREDLPALRRAKDPHGDIAKLIAESSDMVRFTQSVSAWPGGVKNADDTAVAIETLALGQMNKHGRPALLATADALSAVIREKYAFGTSNGKVFHVQRFGADGKARDVDLIESGADYLLRTLKPEGLTLGRPEYRAPVSKEKFDGIKRGGHWVTNRDVTGVALVDYRGSSVNRDGKQIEFTWEQLEASQPPPPPPRRPGYIDRIPGIN